MSSYQLLSPTKASIPPFKPNGTKQISVIEKLSIKLKKNKKRKKNKQTKTNTTLFCDCGEVVVFGVDVISGLRGYVVGRARREVCEMIGFKKGNLIH